jgi:uncharacterized membrane protein
MQVPGSAAAAGKLESAHRAVRILTGDFAIVGLSAFAAQFDLFIKAIFSFADRETHKHFFTLHLFMSFQVLNGFVDGFDQLVCVLKALLKHLPMRTQGGNVFEIGPAEHLFDLLQFEAQFAVK